MAAPPGSGAARCPGNRGRAERRARPAPAPRHSATPTWTGDFLLLHNRQLLGDLVQRVWRVMCASVSGVSCARVCLVCAHVCLVCVRVCLVRASVSGVRARVCLVCARVCLVRVSVSGARERVWCARERVWCARERVCRFIKTPHGRGGMPMRAVFEKAQRTLAPVKVTGGDRSLLMLSMCLGRCLPRSLQAPVAAGPGRCRPRSLQAPVAAGPGRCRPRSLQAPVAAGPGRCRPRSLQARSPQARTVEAAKLDGAAVSPAWPPDPPTPTPHPEEQFISEARHAGSGHKDAGTITDVCNSIDLPEVEIISLLEEQLPHYRLRADTIYGYDHDDWLHTPLISPDTTIDLTNEQIDETLKYMLLCAERVGQMTKTYNDIDAVTRLLEEAIHYPGKSMCSTSSTYTVTTCRILHPSDQLTHLTSSLQVLPTSFCGSVGALSSPPAGSPCTPRRLSLAESFTNLREGTTTTSTSLGLVRLLKERGISAAIYQSLGPSLQLPKPPTLPSTPPNSPLLPPGPWPDSRGPSGPQDPFLASLPASSLLKELRGEKTTRHVDSQTEVSMSRIGLVARVKRLGIGKAVESAPRPPDGTLDSGDGGRGLRSVATLLGDGQAHISLSPIGGLHLNAGIRRNRSLPTMMGASMQIRGPVSVPTGIMMGPALPPPDLQ
ncbi:uncharacterized protein LOC144610980 [Rhinoraja longicauda]